MKGQITIEYLFSMVFYIVFLTIIIATIFNYSNKLEKSYNTLSEYKNVENIARELDLLYSSNSHFSRTVDKEYFLENNLVCSTDNTCAKTIYSGELDGEAS